MQGRTEYTHDKLHETIRCQRNWDWDNQVTPEHLAILDEYVAKPAQQQGERMFSVARIHNDMEKISDIHDNLNKSNTQVLAPLVYIWFPLDEHVWDHHLQAGFHAGIISKLANELGYATGFCGCGASENSEWSSITEKYNLTPVEDYKDPIFILSIGHGKPDTPYNKDHLENFIHTHHRYDHAPVKTV